MHSVEENKKSETNKENKEKGNKEKREKERKKKKEFGGIRPKGKRKRKKEREEMSKERKREEKPKRKERGRKIGQRRKEEKMRERFSQCFDDRSSTVRELKLVHATRATHVYQNLGVCLTPRGREFSYSSYF